MMRAWLLGLCLACASLGALAAPVTLSVSCGDAEIPVTRYPAKGKTLIVWLPSEVGVTSQDGAVAEKLAAQGHEVWIADLYGARFLPVVASSAEEIPAGDVEQLLRVAVKSKKRVYLLTSARGAKYGLEGVRQWQQQGGKKSALAGALLLYPNLYAKQPDPGEDPVYLPIASQTRIPIDILQGDLSPWYWTLDTLTAAFKQGGSRVRVKIIPGVRDRYYFREHANPHEQELGARLAEDIAAMLKPAARSKK